MTLDGYRITAVDPWITASNSSAIVTASNSTAGTAIGAAERPLGQVRHRDQLLRPGGGRSRWNVFVNDREVGNWTGNMEDVLGHAASTKLDGGSAVRVTLPPVQLEPGDTLKVVGTPDGKEPAPLRLPLLLPRK